LPVLDRKWDRVDQNFESALKINSYLANQEIREQYLNCSTKIINSEFPKDIKQNAFDFMSSVITDQITNTPNDARIFVLGGTSMLQIGQINYALPLLSKANELSPQKQSIKIYYGNALANIGQLDQAIQLFKEAYESAPEFSDLKRTYISGLVMAGKEAEARKLFPKDQDLFMNDDIANYYMRSKQYVKAIEIFKYLRDKDKTDINRNVRLAQAYYDSQDKENAISTIKSLEESHPELKNQIKEVIKQFEK
jgi:tetratricopeptide (TPR) repeat protein